jgi:hypothetical protein
MIKTIGLTCILLLCSFVFIFADGAGGMLLGIQKEDRPFPHEVSIRSILYYGGFGYGVVRSNYIFGGFGYWLGDQDYDNIAGGIGGAMFGLRFINRPLFVALFLNMGAGGIAVNVENHRDSMYFVLFGEILLEAGIPVTSKYMISGYVGYQVMENVISESGFDTFFSYNPVIGVRISIGKFY